MPEVIVDGWRIYTFDGPGRVVYFEQQVKNGQEGSIDESGNVEYEVSWYEKGGGWEGDVAGPRRAPVSVIKAAIAMWESM